MARHTHTHTREHVCAITHYLFFMTMQATHVMMANICTPPLTVRDSDSSPKRPFPFSHSHGTSPPQNTCSIVSWWLILNRAPVGAFAYHLLAPHSCSLTRTLNASLSVVCVRVCVCYVCGQIKHAKINARKCAAAPFTRFDTSDGTHAAE